MSLEVDGVLSAWDDLSGSGFASRATPRQVGIGTANGTETAAIRMTLQREES
jgi:hypothetical protein